MFRPRIIPVLLLKNNGLVKSKQFAKHQYIGDPMNAVRIFNDLLADELIFLDIDATKNGRCIHPDLVREIGEEANMPFAVGGGIQTISQIRSLIQAGAEKVIIGSEAIRNPNFIQEAANTFGSSTISVCMDVKKSFWGKPGVYSQNGKKLGDKNIIEFAKKIDQLGAGELIIQSIEKDGMFNGYDLSLIESISKAISIPVVALGGARDLSDMKEAYSKGYASALAAGSMFVYQGRMNGVLINYPPLDEINSSFFE